MSDNFTVDLCVFLYHDVNCGYCQGKNRLRNLNFEPDKEFNGGPKIGRFYG